MRIFDDECEVFLDEDELLRRDEGHLVHDA